MPVMSNLTCLVCLSALDETYRDLDDAWCHHTKAGEALMEAHERLEHVLDQSVQPPQWTDQIEICVRKEEAALVEYERAAARLSLTEQRWTALKAALAYEQEMMLLEPLPRQRLH
jgi:hypothetical protein